MGREHNPDALSAGEIACIDYAVLPAAVTMHDVGFKVLAYDLEISEVAHSLHLSTELHAFHELVDVLRHHFIGFRIDVQDFHAQKRLRNSILSLSPSRRANPTV